MTLEQVSTHTMFDRCVRMFDVLQRIYMRGFAYIKPVKDCTTVFGAVLSCNTRQFVQRRIRFFGVFEHNLTYYTLGKLREGDFYVDIGANVGYFSLLASQCVGSTGKVIAVEADPETFKDLIGNLELNNIRNVEARNVAATETACKVRIERVRNNSGANSIALAEHDGVVEGAPLRDIIGGDVKRVRFIKIDIEGSEKPVLNEILDLLPDLPQNLIIAAEISENSAAYVALFAKSGFRAYAIQNVYTIDYYLIRSYLGKYGEDKLVHLTPVDAFQANCRDYVFERIGVR
jgi:FkbM family methyltransferase